MTFPANSVDEPFAVRVEGLMLAEYPLDPRLEKRFGHFSAAARRRLARKLAAWAMQLEISAAVMKAHAKNGKARRGLCRLSTN